MFEIQTRGQRYFTCTLVAMCAMFCSSCLQLEVLILGWSAKDTGWRYARTVLGANKHAARGSAVTASFFTRCNTR